MVASLHLLESAKAGEFDRSSAESSEGLWQSDRPGFHPDLTYPTLYTLGLQGGSLAFVSSLDRDVTGYTGVSFDNFRDGFVKGPRWDDDEWYWNYLAHPLAGSEIYLRARAQGCTPIGSLLFVSAASTFWEFGIESWYERPSGQDLIITPLAGALLGEARFRAKRTLLETDTSFSRIVVIAIDPIQSLAEVVGRAFGQDWTEPVFRKWPTTTSQSRPIFGTGLASNNGSLSLTVQCSIAF